MAISWDYMAGVKATAAGQKTAAEQNRATQQSYANNVSRIRAQERQLENDKIAAEAQDSAIRESNRLTEQNFQTTFDKTQDNNFGLNPIFEKTNQNLVTTFNSIKADKDMDPAEQARISKVLLSQVPLLASGKKFLNDQMAAFSLGSSTGDISSSMDPIFQQVYADLLKGKFDGGIDFEGDKLVFSGTTSTGQNINKPLEEFELNFPTVVNKVGSLTDASDAYVDTLIADIDIYEKTGSNKAGKRAVPGPPGDTERDLIETRIEGMEGGDSLYMYGMDTLGLSREVIEDRINALEGTKVTEPMINEGIDISNLPDSPFGNQNLEGKPQMMTRADAKLKVMEEMVDQEMNVLNAIYNKTMGRKQGVNPPKSEASLVDKTYVGIAEENFGNFTNAIAENKDGTLNLQSQDFNIAKSAGFDNIASNITEGYNDSGDYLVSYEQASSVEYEDGTRPTARKTSYNLSTTAGAKDYLLARFNNEQGARGASAAQVTESKLDAIALAPTYAEFFRDAYKARIGKQKADAESEKYRLEQERIKAKQAEMESLIKDFDPKTWSKLVKQSSGENVNGVIIK
tara:strand:+ start:553 stop:2265 length:1713 start_codon:yes stop_codon:yes gene_type:complete